MKTLTPSPEEKGINGADVRATDIGAYVYNEKTLCARCVRDIVVPLYRIADTRISTEQILNEAAAKAGIDRLKEQTFTSAEFPHVIYSTDLIPGYDYCYVNPKHRLG
ncbi:MULTISPECIES: hypothetical protein [Kitasatospora]|uniref:Uncharacterized protein n=1 Tax=Kitasatospora setae (strain ATCC 33774 / DSM 43861 / JCM 3304 / KCC A-0304 / NBRC 14216 / KM-6054) TaxID=452652 RepID=E4NHL3_KITSK|nr:MULTISPECIES: hypothetical protein [Kitasatospora]BAJ30993.1 hypothetical protein KSE_52170 [Kitasatospora setae KM-6054]